MRTYHIGGYRKFSECLLSCSLADLLNTETTLFWALNLLSSLAHQGTLFAATLVESLLPYATAV